MNNGTSVHDLMNINLLILILILIDNLNRLYLYQNEFKDKDFMRSLQLPIL